MAEELTQRAELRENGWMVWTVANRIDMKTAETAYVKGEALLQENEKLVMDMKELEYISSAGLRVLLRLSKLAKKLGKEFTVAGASGMVLTVLEDSSMNVLLNAKASVDDLS